MTNFLSDAQVRTLRAESQFVGDVFFQVDLCPFRGPDAPSCAIRRYHADRQMSKNRSYAESSPRKTTGAGLDLSKGRVAGQPLRNRFHLTAGRFHPEPSNLL
jgi:hypothetical protein